MARAQQKPAVIEQRVTAVVVKEAVVIDVCDWCGEEIPVAGLDEIREFTLETLSGKTSPYGGSSSGWVVENLCGGCVEKLRELLDSNGITIVDVAADW